MFFIPPEPRDTGEIDYEGGVVAGIGRVERAVNAVLVVVEVDEQLWRVLLLLCVAGIRTGWDRDANGDCLTCRRC